MSEAVEQVEHAPEGGLAHLGEQATSYARASLSDATRAAYARDWADFLAWCRTHGRAAMPADAGTVCDYVAACADLRIEDVPVYAPATLTRRLAAIAAMHAWNGHPSPTSDPSVRVVAAGARRTLSRQRPRRVMSPMLLADLRRIGEHLPTTWPACVAARRDWALLLLGWAGAFRRSELAKLTWRDLRPSEGGLIVTVTGSKTDQENRGQVKAIPKGRTGAGMCPLCALATWARAQRAGIDQDRAGLMSATLRPPRRAHVCQEPWLAGAREDRHRPVFSCLDRHGNIGDRPLSGHAVAAVVASRASQAGLEGTWGGHSLRAGFVTEALRRGASYAEVMAQSGHTDPATVEVYNRQNNPFAANAVQRLGL